MKTLNTLNTVKILTILEEENKRLEKENKDLRAENEFLKKTLKDITAYLKHKINENKVRK